MDAVRKPNVETLVKIGKFESAVVAYRAVTEAETKMAARQYLANTKSRSYPKTGKVPRATVAREMGMTKQAYQRLEDPKANLSVKMLKRIAESMDKHLEVQFV